jgi:GNAT superfamily N-acetyltransferase
MGKTDFEIKEISKADRPLIALFIKDCWGSSMIVSRGRIFYPSELPGFICKKDDLITGLLTYHIDNRNCEIVTLNSQIANRGLATQLIQKVIEKAKDSGCLRVWLITTNDNIHALRFYQKRGFEWVAFYRNSIEDSRKLKPEIPEYGDDGIPLKHEIEFELRIKMLML